MSSSQLLPGYSWLSNQYGLSLDNVVAMELVLPTGEIKTVTETSNPDLWFALRVRICINSYSYHRPSTESRDVGRLQQLRR